MRWTNKTKTNRIKIHTCRFSANINSNFNRKIKAMINKNFHM